MSGVLALFDRRGISVERDRFRSMLDRLTHRGPDGTGQWLGEAVGLGHQHLVSTPEEEDDDQPRRTENYILTADVRLDNRSALLGRLLPSVTGTIPDSRLLLAAYRQWGAQCVERLRGAFAFAIWDAHRQRLFCARDRLGVKPLYYAQTSDAFAAASEPGPLFALPEVTHRPDERRLGDFLVGRYGKETDTFYDDLSRLPPGYSLTVTTDRCTPRRYWSPEDVEPFPPDIDVDFAERFRDLFTDAVDVRLRSPEPVGAFLSGGLDSSSIASTASHLRTQRGDPPLRTFSAVFDTITACDERPYIDAVLDAGEFRPHFVHGDEVEPLEGVDRYLQHRLAPYYPSLIMLVLALYREVERRNVRVVLHGYGGDQTMGSDARGYFRGLARRGEIATLARELRGYGDRHGLPVPEVLLEDVLKPLIPKSVRRLRHRFFDEDHYLDTRFASIDREFARRTGLLDSLVADAVSPPPRAQRTLVRRALMNGEPTFNLELNDAVAAAHGIEPRYPYFDSRLVEFALALPPEETVHRGFDRAIVRRSLDGVLPDVVRNRADKTEFSPNVLHTTRTYALERIESTLFDRSPAVSRYLGGDDLCQALDRLEQGGNVSDARPLLMATTLERWLRDSTERPG